MVGRQSTTAPTKALHSKVNSLAAKILLKNSKDGFKEGNFVCSPVSLEILLSMIACGAKGQTLEELLCFLGWNSLNELHSKSPALKLLSKLISPSNDNGDNGGQMISVANEAWVQEPLPLLSSYKDILGSIYQAQAKSVDFQKDKGVQAAKEINSWVDKETKGLINQIVEASDFCGEDTNPRALILANALYFKGSWEDPFDTEYTKDLDFHLLNGDIIQVPFMRAFHGTFLYGTLDDIQILELPYKTGNRNDLQCFSMFFFLPKDRNCFQSMIEKFHSDPGLFQKKFYLYYKELEPVCIPKFKISCDLNPKETMKQMGLTSPFRMKKELTGVVDSPAGDLLFVSKILQKACIEVEEKGTEAAAVTWDNEDIGFGLDSPPHPPPPPPFVADHPFLFMIREKNSNAVLFVGAVVNPEQS